MKSTNPSPSSAWVDESIDFQEKRSAIDESLLRWLRESIASEVAIPTQRLLPLIRHGDNEVRRLALDLIEYQNAPTAISALLEAAADEDIVVAVESAEVLRHFRNPEADRELVIGLKHPSLSVRLAAISALRERRSPVAIEPLVILLGDVQVEIRREVVTTLANYHREDLLLALRSAVRDGDPTVRRIAVEALEDFDGSSVFGDLLLASADENWKVRRASARSLGRFPSQATAFALRTALDDSAWQVVAEALSSLARISASADRTILALLHHEVPEVRLAAATVVGQSNEPIFTPYLGAILHDPNDAVKKAARFAIARLTAINNETNLL